MLPFLFGLLITSPALAQRERDTYTGSNQTFEVAGQARLAETGEVASKVPVRLERFSGGVVDQIDTDSQGRFRFPNLQRGYYKVIISAPGFRPAQQDADLQVLFRIFLAFDLIPDKPKGSAGEARLLDVIDARVPAEAREAFNQGRTALVKKNHAEAIGYFQKAIFLYPEFFDAHLLLGTSFMDMREWEKAENALRHALGIKPDNPAALLSVGEVYWRQRRYQEAEATLLEGLKLDDKSWHGHFTLSRLYWDMGDVKKAGPPLGRTLQLKPDFAEAHLLAGNVLLRVGQQERALIEYQEYLRLAPKGEFASQTRELVQKLSKMVAEKKL
jgi:tetratricopeptide (TPR) repeat protein